MDFIENEHRARLVLVVDDEPSVLNFIKYILEGSGSVVMTAENSIEALILAAEFQGRIDLLLTDVQMKVHRNGMELASCFQFMRPDTRVLLTSGSPCPDFAGGYSGIGNKWEFLSKPFSDKELLDAVHHSMETDLGAMENQC